MRRLLLSLPLVLAAAACATGPRPYAPVRAIAYQAMGQEPAWHVVIGDDRIVFGPVAGGGDRSWPRVLPRTEGDVRTWQSGTGADGITISASRFECSRQMFRGGGVFIFEDTVTVRIGEDGPELSGCGGQTVTVVARRQG